MASLLHNGFDKKPQNQDFPGGLLYRMADWSNDIVATLSHLVRFSGPDLSHWGGTRVTGCD
jgi:hypothetical protein